MGNMHVICTNLELESTANIKYRRMIVVIDNIEYHYRCTHSVWNWYLNRYYPKAELVQVVKHHNRIYN